MEFNVLRLSDRIWKNNPTMCLWEAYINHKESEVRNKNRHATQTVTDRKVV